MSRNYVILAPHVDDEYIGCSHQMSNVKKIIYFFELTPERKKEAEKLCDYFDAECVFMKDAHSVSELHNHVDHNDVLLVPNINDYHIDHKRVNMMAKQLFHKKLYYSIDMNVAFKKNTSAYAKIKKELFLKHYPSQKELANNEVYFLFESLLKTDEETFITVKTQFEALHNYPAAPDEVAFLRNLHRHIFKINVSIQVFHDDRELEFFMFKNEIEKHLRVSVFKEHSIGSMSCEMIADIIMHYIYGVYPDRSCEVSVSEDGENGVTKKFNGMFNREPLNMRINL